MLDWLSCVLYESTRMWELQVLSLNNSKICHNKLICRDVIGLSLDVIGSLCVSMVATVWSAVKSSSRPMPRRHHAAPRCPPGAFARATPALFCSYSYGR